MSSATISSASVASLPSVSAIPSVSSARPVSRHPVRGATALGPDPSGGTADAHEHRHLVGNALRAVKVFAAAAFSVVVMGEYTEG
ncbi:hypothetical protein GCM10010211_36230 [Streptomyces albospinus]|uniref:Uncharacterized protein n=1 Tax=Streptomyces albospinus TaxID=285515 RepID=A0ABQ2V3U4_9ACTN|nr:hypothetical protein [Streptomyces albospinus]GGU67592.1 hypothetical protein GCM10010211_36230 [Streptomyces albospinus]